MIPTASDTNNEEPKATSGTKRSHQAPSDEEGDSKRAALSTEDGSAGDSQPEDAEDEAHKLEEKRAYNRRNAARARQRVKDQLTDLSEKVENFSHLNDTLKQANEELQDKVKVLTEENQSLKLHMSSNGLSVGGMGKSGGFDSMKQGSGAKSDFLSLKSKQEAAMGQSHKGWNTGTGFSASGLEQNDSSTLPSQLLLARQQQLQHQYQPQHQNLLQQHHVQPQQQPAPGSEAALTLQLLLAREIERQRTSGTTQDASSSALSSLPSHMFSGMQAEQHPPPSLSYPGTGAPGVQQGSDDPAERQRAMIMALLTRNNRNQQAPHS
jgi:hypothetical protein